MNLLFLAFILFACQTAILSQITLPIPGSNKTQSEWSRVLTLDANSFVELNNDYVMFSSDATARVRFRWSYAKAQKLTEDIKYKTILQETAYDCRSGKYYYFETKWFDGDEKLVQTVSAKKDEEWQKVSGKTREELYAAACKLIELRRREPATEK